MGKNTFIQGTIKFWGIKDAYGYNPKSKKYDKPLGFKNRELTIEVDADNSHIDIDEVLETLSGVSEDKYPKWVRDFIANGTIPQYFNAHSKVEYDTTKVFVVDENNKVVSTDISNVYMNNAYVRMIYNGSYIGAILVIKNGEPYGTPFDTFVETDIELPFS